LNKINETYVTKILELAEKDDERAFADAQASKKYILGYVLIFAMLKVIWIEKKIKPCFNGTLAFVFYRLYLQNRAPAAWSEL